MSTLRSWIKKGFEPMGELLSARREGGGVLLECIGGSLRLTFPAEGVMRIRSGRGSRFSEDRSFALAGGPEQAISPEVSEGPDKVEVSGGGLRLSASRSPFGFSVYDSEDERLFRLHPRVGLGWPTRGGTVFSFEIEPRSHYYGFGEKTGPLDKLGTSMTMWTTDMVYTTGYDPIYISIPLAVAARDGRAHGLFFDNPCRSRFNVGKSPAGVFSYLAEAGELDLYLIAGPGVGDVVRRYTGLTGRMPMPPRWSLGHHQCRWSYMNEEEVRRIARGFRERDLPCDVIYMDIHYMDRYRVFTFNKKRFPDVKRMSEDLGREGFRLAVAIDPGVAVADDYEVYREGRERGLFCLDEEGGEFHSRVWPGKVAFPDFTNPDAREWWGDWHRVLVEAGISGVWNDMNEPSCWTFDVRPLEAVIPLKPVRHPRMVHHDGGRNTPHLCMRNVYGLLECEGAYQGLLRHRPGERPFILSRSGYAGIQRWAAVWTGDNSSRFSHLKLSLPMLLNLGLSGVAFSGPDIGGFMWNCSPELYARWIELGAFYPFCRTHSALRTRRQEPWRFGEEVLRISREHLKLRYRLHPTLYSLFRECHETGAPVLRPLFYEFPEDHTAWQIDDQAMFGSWLLLAPVVKKGAREREVYLPAGTWTDFWSGERIQGPRTFEAKAPLERIPVYAREGSILFMWPPMSWLCEREAEALFVHLYPPSRGATESVLYEDDGESLDYLEGTFCKRRFSQEAMEGGVRLRIGAKEGPYEPPARTLALRVHLLSRPAGIEIDGRAVKPGGADPGCDYVVSEGVLKVSMPDDGGAHEILIQYR